jgi:hypothetical protein
MTKFKKNFLRCRRAFDFPHSLGQTLPDRADGRSGHAGFLPIAAGFCRAAEFRDGPGPALKPLWRRLMPDAFGRQ